MRTLAGGVLLCVLALSAATAKESASLALSLSASHAATTKVCGISSPTVHARQGEPVVASVTLQRGAGDSRTPFVIAVRRCDRDRLTTVLRLRRELPPGRRSVTATLRGLQVGMYRVEALRRGDRRAPSSATRNLVVLSRTPSPKPRILSVLYGQFRPAGAPQPYYALRVRTLDPDGQVVALGWEQVAPSTSSPVTGQADGACGLAHARNGSVGTWYLPIQLDPGSYRFRFEIDSSACIEPDSLQHVTQEAHVRGALAVG